MKEENVPMLKLAMHYGALLGLFWMFKYAFLIISGFTTDLFLYLYYILNIGTFMLVYLFYFKYKFSDADNPRSMGYCLMFVIAMCFFATFFEGALIYAHYEFIDPSFFDTMTQRIIKMLESFSATVPNYPQEAIDAMEGILTSKAYYISIQFLNNIIIGTFLGLVLGIFTRNIKNINRS